MADDYRGLFEAAITRLQPGNAMEQAAFEQIESGKRTAIGGAMQNLVGGGLASTSLTASVPIIAEKAAASSRLGVTAAREQQLSSLQTALGGLLFQGTEREKAQQFTAAQNELNQKFTAAQAALNREYSSVEARKSEAYQTKQAQLTRDFNAAQNALDRQAGIATQNRSLAATAAGQSSAQKFTAEQNALGRTATAEQNALQLAAQYPALDYSAGRSVPDIFGGGTTASTGGGWSSFLGSTGTPAGAPATGQSWVNGQYIPTQAEEKTYYSQPTAAGPTSIRSAIENITKTTANAPGGANWSPFNLVRSYGGW